MRHASHPVLALLTPITSKSMPTHLNPGPFLTHNLMQRLQFSSPFVCPSIFFSPHSCFPVRSSDGQPPAAARMSKQNDLDIGVFLTGALPAKRQMCHPPAVYVID